MSFYIFQTISAINESKRLKITPRSSLAPKLLLHLEYHWTFLKIYRVFHMTKTLTELLKKYFITGLVALLPITVTVILVNFTLEVFSKPFMGLFKPLLNYIHWRADSFIFSSEQFLNFLCQVFILCSLIITIIVLGMLTRWFLLNLFLRFTDAIISKIPVVSTVYKTTQELTKTLFGSQASAFRQVVLIPYPREGCYSIAFTTQDFPHPCSKVIGEALISVLVPTAPNPASGFLILCKQEEVIFLDMRVEDAFKYMFSCGVINPETVQRVVQPEEKPKDA